MSLRTGFFMLGVVLICTSHVTAGIVAIFLAILLLE
jgi:hypothetical protein